MLTMNLYLLDSSFTIVDIVDSYESLIWTERYFSYSDFELVLAATKENCDRFITGSTQYLLKVDSQKIMEIETTDLTTSSESGNSIKLSGKSLEYLLHRRVIWGQMIYEGSLHDCIKQIFQDSIENPENAKRKIDDFSFADSEDERVLEPQISAQFYGENVYDTVAELCEANNIGFRVDADIQNKQFYFELFSGDDRSYNQTTHPYVVFSPSFENLNETEQIHSSEEYCNIAFVSGEGEGSNKMMTDAFSETEPEGYSRRELYFDGSSVSKTTDGGTLPDEEYLAQLKQQGLDSLTEHQMIDSFDGKLETNSTFSYGTDYFIGDIVQIATQFGASVRARVTEFIFSHEKGTIEHYPTFSMINEVT